MIDAGVVGIGFGSYLGLLFHAKFFPCLLLRKTTSDKRWYGWPLLRCILGVVICIPILSLLMLKRSQIENVYALALMKTFTPTFVSGFEIFGILDWLCMKLGILTFEGDVDFELTHSADDSVKSLLLDHTERASSATELKMHESKEQ